MCVLDGTFPLGGPIFLSHDLLCYNRFSVTTMIFITSADCTRIDSVVNGLVVTIESVEYSTSPHRIPLHYKIK